MRFYRVITLAVIAAISATLVSCDDDDDNGGIPGSESVLPTLITTTYSYGENTENETISFRYNESGNDTTSIISFSKSKDGGDAIEFSVVYSNAQVIAVKQGNETVYTYETVTPKSTGGSTATRLITKKDAQGNSVAYITVNSSNQVVSYSEESEDAEDREVSTYTYSGKNISKEVIKEGEENVVTGTYSYNSNSGVFKNVTTPQWFIVTEFGVETTVLSGQVHNAVTKLTAVSADNKKVEYPVNYQSLIKGFPTKFSIKYNDIDEETEKTLEVTEQYVVTYNVAK